MNNFIEKHTARNRTGGEGFPRLVKKMNTKKYGK